MATARGPIRYAVLAVLISYWTLVAGTTFCAGMRRPTRYPATRASFHRTAIPKLIPAIRPLGQR